MFNIYYINYEKAYEIAMLIDNKIVEQRTKEKNTEGSLGGDASMGTGGLTSIPFIGNYMPEIKLDGEVSGTKSHKVIDTIKVISTKSTILDKIYSKASEVHKLNDNTIGKLIKIKNISLSVQNEDDILGAKTMLSGAIGEIPVDGIGSVNLTTFLEVLLKDSAYILEGDLPQKRFEKEEKLIIKIPMQAENEMENQYSICDLEIGKVTLIGIYRGGYESAELNTKINKLKKSNKSDTETFDAGIESDDEENNSEIVHYIDIIAIVQDISF